MSQLSTDWTRPMKCDQCPHPISEHTNLGPRRTVRWLDALHRGRMHNLLAQLARPRQATRLEILSRHERIRRSQRSP
jgi:hypothetical protein